MNETLDLPPEKEAAMKAVAQAQAVSTDQWLQHLVEARLQNTAQPGNAQPSGQNDWPDRRLRSRVFLEAADDAKRKVCTLRRVPLYTDCRISEALFLTADPVDLEKGTLLFRT